LWPLALQTADWEAVLHPLAADNEDSKATVREALQHLEHSGLVTRRENVGSLVTGLSPKDIRERLTLRVTLEVMAAHFRASTVPQDRSIRRTFRRELWARTAETDEGEQQS
jgi:DNA-binding GntR family transcriptional regulator